MASPLSSDRQLAADRKLRGESRDADEALKQAQLIRDGALSREDTFGGISQEFAQSDAVADTMAEYCSDTIEIVCGWEAEQKTIWTAVYR